VSEDNIKFCDVRPRKNMAIFLFLNYLGSNCNRSNEMY